MASPRKRSKVFEAPPLSSEPEESNLKISSFNPNTRLEFGARLLGIATGLRRSSDDLIDYIDKQKVNGNIGWRSSADDSVRLLLTKYGLKIADLARKETHLRAPLHRIGSVVYYTEASNQHMVVMEIAQKTQAFKYVVFEVDTEERAKDICNVFSAAFAMLEANV